MLRRVWIGDPPPPAVAPHKDRFRAAAPDRAKQHWAPDGGLVAATDPAEVAQRLDAQIRATGCTAINLRVFHAGVTPAAVRDQIERIGAEVLPRLRAAAPTWQR